MFRIFTMILGTMIQSLDTPGLYAAASQLLWSLRTLPQISRCDIGSIGRDLIQQVVGRVVAQGLLKSNKCKYKRFGVIDPRSRGWEYNGTFQDSMLSVLLQFWSHFPFGACFKISRCAKNAICFPALVLVLVAGFQCHSCHGQQCCFSG